MSGTSLSVLVVDDDFRVASLHVDFVERVEGFHVVGDAHSGGEALDMAGSLHPDLVLMDIYLPDIDGLATLQQMLSLPSPPAAIVISAANDVASVRSALRLGVVDYLVKPFGFAALSERLTTFRLANERLDQLPNEATQGDINRVFEQSRPIRRKPSGSEFSRLAPTLQAVYDAIAAADTGLSAAEIAGSLGVSRATAQRSLTQLEQSEAILLDLRYGRTGRPEHRYTLRRRG
ncbi:MAG: response regulator [Pseudolysinimonas sp.]